MKWIYLNSIPGPAQSGDPRAWVGFAFLNWMLIYPLLYWTFLRKFQSESMHQATLTMFVLTAVVYASWLLPCALLFAIVLWPVWTGLFVILPAIAFLRVFTVGKLIDEPYIKTRRKAIVWLSCFYAVIALSFVGPTYNPYS